MPTTFLSLPLGIRQEVYQYAIPNSTTIVLTLRTKGRKVPKRQPNAPAQMWAMPRKEDVKAQLAPYKKLITLLFVSKQVSADVKTRVYTNVILRCSTEEPFFLNVCTTNWLVKRYMEIPGLYDLMQRVKKNELPWVFSYEWRRLGADGAALPPVRF